MKGITGDNMLQLLELRLDNVVYRLGLGQDPPHGSSGCRPTATSASTASKVDIPSYTGEGGRRDHHASSSPLAAGNVQGLCARAPAVRDPQVADLRRPEPDRHRECAASRVRISTCELQENLIVEFYSR